MSEGMGQGGEEEEEVVVEEGANERSILRLFNSERGGGGEDSEEEQDENEVLVNEEEGANKRFFLGTNLLFESEEDLNEHVIGHGKAFWFKVSRCPKGFPKGTEDSPPNFKNARGFFYCSTCAFVSRSLERKRIDAAIRGQDFQCDNVLHFKVVADPPTHPPASDELVDEEEGANEGSIPSSYVGPQRTAIQNVRFGLWYLPWTLDRNTHHPHSFARLRTKDACFKHNHSPIHNPNLAQPPAGEHRLFEVTNESQLNDAERQHLISLAHTQLLRLKDVRLSMNLHFQETSQLYGYQMIRKFVYKIRNVSTSCSTFSAIQAFIRKVNENGGMGHMKTVQLDSDEGKTVRGGAGRLWSAQITVS